MLLGFWDSVRRDLWTSAWWWSQMSFRSSDQCYWHCCIFKFTCGWCRCRMLCFTCFEHVFFLFYLLGGPNWTCESGVGIHKFRMSCIFLIIFFCRLVIDHANFVLMFWGNEHATVTGEWESIVCRCFLYFVSTFKSNTTEEKQDLLRVTKHTGRLGVSLTQSRSVLDLFKQVVPVSTDLDFLIHTISRPTDAC